jgi:putative transposase
LRFGKVRRYSNISVESLVGKISITSLSTGEVRIHWNFLCSVLPRNSSIESTLGSLDGLGYPIKYRRQVIYGKIKADIGQILRKLCDQKGVEIIEANACPDHIHMLVSIPPKISVSSFMGYLKGKSSLMIFDRHANLKYKYGNRHFWCKGFYVDTVGNIRTQLQSIYKTNYRMI